MQNNHWFLRFLRGTNRKVLLVAAFTLSPLFIGLVGAIFVRDDGLTRDLLARAYVITNIITMIIFLSLGFLAMAFDGESRHGRPSSSPIDPIVKVTFIGSTIQAAAMTVAWFAGAQGVLGPLHVIPGLVAAVTLLTLIWVSWSKR
jgi:predicted secreted protein